MSSSDTNFKQNYQNAISSTLSSRVCSPKTIEAYTRAIRRIGAYFDEQIDDLTEQQLTDYFTDLLESHSWSAVKLDLYGLKFYYTHVLHKPWENIDLIKPPKTQRLPDIVTIDEAKTSVHDDLDAQLPRLLFHHLQPGPAPWRRTAS